MPFLHMSEDATGFSVPLRRRITLRQLELLAALERGLTLSAAAAEVKLSQSAASRLLNVAARDLGVDLFRRAGRRLEPTPVGHALIARAARLIGDLDRAQTELAAIRDGRIGSVTLGAGAGASYALAPRALTLLLDRAPGVVVVLREGSVEELLSLLHDGRLDLIVGRIEPAHLHRDLEVHDLYDPAICVVTGPRHPLSRRRTVSWNMLLKQHWILPQANTPMRGWIENTFRQLGERPQACPIESSSIPANVALLGERNLLWPVSIDIAARFVDAGLLHILPTPRLTGAGALLAVQWRLRPLSPAAQRMLECIRIASRNPLAPNKSRLVARRSN
jgi:DNA-binding transcriptional LysR family regulator